MPEEKQFDRIIFVFCGIIFCWDFFTISKTTIDALMKSRGRHTTDINSTHGKEKKDRQTDRHTDGQRDRRTERQIYRETERRFKHQNY